MNYLERIAEEIRHEIPADALPDADTDDLFLLYAVLLLTRGADTTPEDVHNAWTAWMTARGEHHPSMVPFSELPNETQAEDSVFVDAIRRVALRLNR
jgi:hypothetical protein